MSASTNVGKRVLTGTRVLFGATFVVALVLGYVGIARFVDQLPSDSVGRDFWDVVYYDMQLFVLGSSPLDRAGPYPPALAVARFLAPAASLYAIFEATRALFADQARQWWWRSVRRGHVIVTGDSSTAVALIDRFQRSAMRRRVIGLDSVDAVTLRDAGIGGASALYACADDTGDSSVNVVAAFAAVDAKRRRWRRRRLSVYAQVSDPTLALALRARRLGVPRSESKDVDFFNVDELAARALMDVASVSVPAGHTPHIVVAGGSTFGRAVVVEYAYFWLLHSPRRRERVLVTLVDPDAETIVADLTARWDVVNEVLELKAVPGDIAAAFRAAHAMAPHRTYVCYDDEDLALREALTVASLWRGGPDSLVVRLSRLHRHSEVFRGSSSFLLDDFGGRLRIEGTTKLATEAGVIERSLVERLAQAIHEQYVVEQLHDGITSGAVLTPWHELSDDLRAANRAQARDIGVKLTMIDCTVAPRVGAAVPVHLKDSEVESLAIHEHDRWCAERKAHGWTYAPVRDSKARKHPSLVAWSELSEAERDKDRDAVRNLPAVLAHVGLRILRLSQTAVPIQTSHGIERVD